MNAILALTWPDACVCCTAIVVGFPLLILLGAGLLAWIEERRKP